MNIAFLEAVNAVDLTAEVPMAYKQIKAYLLKYSRVRESIVMTPYREVADIPDEADIIGVSSTSQNFPRAVAMARAIRQKHPRALLVLGGIHISFLPLTLPGEFDLGVMFEGEQTFLEIVDAYAAAGTKQALQAVRGICYHDTSDSIVVNPGNLLIEPLDVIPFPVAEGAGVPFVFSSRGCPYKCSFCSSSKLWQKVRFFSADYVVAQIEDILETFPNTTAIGFWDDLFIASRSRFREIVEKIEKKGLNQKLTFNLNVRADLVDEEICSLLRRMNVPGLGFGAESGSDRILKMLKGPGASVATNQRALDLLHERGFTVGCSFIIGAPSETREDLKSTFEFIHRNAMAGKLSRHAINILMPLPGTPVWQNALDSGSLAEPISWERLGLFASYKDSRLADVTAWIERRLQNRSYYLNEDAIPHAEMLGMLREFEIAMERVYGLLQQQAKNSALPEQRDVASQPVAEEPSE